MCQFCVEHGEGERWYLNARNYSADLMSDLKRRQYMVDFIRDFSKTRASAIAWMERLDRLPAPLASAGRSAASLHMRPRHFGQPVPIEECEQILAIATSITVIPCICRMHTPGKKAEEVCILVTTSPVEPILAEGFESYSDGPDLDDFHKVTSDEAMTLMRLCEERGLMHSVWTFQTPFTAAICNCDLASGCMAMRLTAGYGMKVMWRGESVALLDTNTCRQCGECARVCPFSALSVDGGVVTLHSTRCWGCGICRTHCPADSLRLVDRHTVPEVAAIW